MTDIIEEKSNPRSQLVDLEGEIIAIEIHRNRKSLAEYRMKIYMADHSIQEFKATVPFPNGGKPVEHPIVGDVVKGTAQVIHPDYIDQPSEKIPEVLNMVRMFNIHTMTGNERYPDSKQDNVIKNQNVEYGKPISGEIISMVGHDINPDTSTFYHELKLDNGEVITISVLGEPYYNTARIEGIAGTTSKTNGANVTHLNSVNYAREGQKEYPLSTDPAISGRRFRLGQSGLE
jgi:hypothetical protein